MGGITPACLQAGQALYESAIQRVVPVSSPEAAEMAKLLENTFRAVNIGLVNEVLLMCDRLGLNAWEVIEAAATKPFGYMRFEILAVEDRRILRVAITRLDLQAQDAAG